MNGLTLWVSSASQEMGTGDPMLLGIENDLILIISVQCVKVVEISFLEGVCDMRPGK